MHFYFWFFLFSSALAGAIVSCSTSLFCYWLVRQEMAKDWGLFLKPVIDHKTSALIDKIKALFPLVASFLAGKTEETLRQLASEEILSTLPEVKTMILTDLKRKSRWLVWPIIFGTLIGSAIFLVACAVLYFMTKYTM